MPDYTGKPCKSCGGKKSPSVAAELRCLKCKRAKRQADRDRNHENRVAKVYKLEPEDYQKLKDDLPNGRCPVCQIANGTARKLAVDHNHKIEDFGKIAVRGLLCGVCNKNIIGAAHDDPEFFLRAYEYLTNPPAWDALGTREAALAALKAVEDGTWL